MQTFDQLAYEARKSEVEEARASIRDKSRGSGMVRISDNEDQGIFGKDGQKPGTPPNNAQIEDKLVHAVATNQPQ